MSYYLHFLWSSLLFFLVVVPLLLVSMALLVLILSPFVPIFGVLRQATSLMKPTDPDRLAKGSPETTWLEINADIGTKDDEILVVLDYSESTGGPVHKGKISMGPIKGQYAVQSDSGEPKRSQSPLGKEGREALRRILASAHDAAAAA